MGCYLTGSFGLNQSFLPVTHSRLAYDVAEELAHAKLPFGRYISFKGEQDFTSWTLKEKK